jgi:hypothetical protein
MDEKMTAEIAIMNKQAIALAADSAVALGKPVGRKVFNTMNKLFNLSKQNPVGILINGDTELLGVPWEVIVKTFRDKLNSKAFDYLSQYADEFINFLDNNKLLFSETAQEASFSLIIARTFSKIQKKIYDEAKKVLGEKHDLTEKITQKIVDDVIDNFLNYLKNLSPLPHLNMKFPGELIKAYEKIIKNKIKETFQRIPLSKGSLDSLKDISAYMFYKDSSLSHSLGSGIVIAGFGGRDIFPSLIEFNLETIVINRLKYQKESQSEININNPAFIRPFAQRDMISAFIEGIHPFQKETLEGYLTELIHKYPGYILDHISLNNEQRNSFKLTAEKRGKELISELCSRMDGFRKEYHIEPILEAVSGLPKDQLAELAESLIHITSLRKKFSIDEETVGGPIDVAVISKGDGFVWIKRKHYFKADLNPGFLAKYSKQEQGR